MTTALLVLSYMAMVPHFGAYVLQVYKTMTKGEVHTLSEFSFAQNYVASLLWGINAIFVIVMPSAIANSISLMGIAILLGYIVKEKSKKNWKGLLILSSLMVVAIALLSVAIANAVSPFIFVSHTVKFIIPLVAGPLLMSMFIPQLVKMIRTKDTKGLSYHLLLLNSLSLMLWATFWMLRGIEGYAMVDWLIPMVFCIISTTIQVIIIWFKYKTEKATPK